MIHPTFKEAISSLREDLINIGEPVHSRKWQGIDISKKPEMAMREIIDTYFRVPLNSEDPSDYQEDIKPNLPWADDHFEERICGHPLNPGIQWEKWPNSQSAKRFLDREGQFNHNYMERFWPSNGISKRSLSVGDVDCWDSDSPQGLRHSYGNLNSLINLLLREPDTRQAFFPIFFPEDTGAVHRGRIPCTIGYQFLMRDQHLHMTYYIRSCDFTRHFRDDIYLAVKLLLWILETLRSMSDDWELIKPGSFSMHIMSLHSFVNDFHKEK